MALSQQKQEELIAKKHQAREDSRKRDTQFLTLVRNGDLKGIQALYPDATSLLKYANVSGPLTRRDSFLATLCKEASPEFVSSFFETYFPESTDETLALKEKFLKGRTYIGEQLDYHWFSKYLNPELTSRVNETFGITNSRASTEENSEKKKIYDIIKKQHDSLQEFHNKKISRYKMGLTLGEEKPGQKYFVMGYDKAGNEVPALSFVEESMPPVILRQLPNLENMTEEEKEKHKDGNDFGKDKVVELEFMGDPSNLLESAYKKLHFPEDYLWASKSLGRLQDEYGQMMQDEKLRSQAKGFAKEGGQILIEDRERKTSQGNSFVGGTTIAFSNGTDVVLNASAYGSLPKGERENHNTLAHELGHDADKKYGGYTQRLENYDWAKWAYMLMDIREKSPLRANITNQIDKNYPADQYVVEFVANLTQRPTEVTAKDENGNPKDPLLSKIYDIIALRGEVASHPNELKWMKDYMDNQTMSGEDADIMKKLYELYSDYAKNVQTVYYKKKDKTQQDEEIHAKGVAETSKKIKEVLDGRTVKEFEQSLTNYLTSMLDGVELGKELYSNMEQTYQRNEQSHNPIMAHLNCLTNENLPVLKKVFDEKNPNVDLYKAVFMNYFERVAGPYGFNRVNEGMVLLSNISFDVIQSAVDKFSNIVLNQSSYKEQELASGLDMSISEFRGIYAKKEGEYTQAQKTGTVQSWLEEKKDLAWQKDAPKEAKQDLVVSVAAVQKDLFNDKFSMQNSILSVKTKEAKNFVSNLPFLASDKNPQGLTPEMFKKMRLHTNQLFLDYEDAKDFKYYENNSTFEREDLGNFIALGREYLKRTGSKTLPKELQLSRITPETISQPKALYESMKKYVGVIENGESINILLSARSLEGERVKEEKNTAKQPPIPPILPPQPQH